MRQSFVPPPGPSIGYRCESGLWGMTDPGATTPGTGVGSRTAVGTRGCRGRGWGESGGSGDPGIDVA